MAKKCKLTEILKTGRKSGQMSGLSGFGIVNALLGPLITTQPSVYKLITTTPSLHLQLSMNNTLEDPSLNISGVSDTRRYSQAGLNGRREPLGLLPRPGYHPL